MGREFSKLIKNTTIYALGDIVPKIISFLIFPVLTSYLSPEDYGIINYVNTLNLLLTILGFCGLNTYYLVYYYRQEDERQQKLLLGNLSLFVIGINLLFTIAVCILGYLFPNLFSDKIEFYPYVFVGIITNFFNLLTILPSALYRMKEKPLPITILAVLRGVIYSIFTVLLVSIYGYKSMGVLVIQMLLSIIFGLIFIGITWRDTLWHFNFSIIKKGLIFSLPLLPGSLAYYFISMSDRFFIERYLDLTQLGIYSTAATLALVINIVTNSAYKSLEPYFFKVYGTENFDYKFLTVRKSYFFITLTACLCIAIYAKEFFYLFASEKYQTVYYYVPMIEVGVIFSAFTLIHATLITAQGRTKINSIFTLIGAAISFLINMFLMPFWGLAAACMASALSCGVIMCLSVYSSNQTKGVYSLFISFLLSAIAVLFLVYCIQWENIYVSISIKTISLFGIIYLVMRIQHIDIKQYVSFLKI